MSVTTSRCLTPAAKSSHRKVIIGTGNICLHNAFKDGSYGAKELALHAAKITSNGISGGITSEIFGGDFIDGMAGGAVSAAFSPISSGMFHDGNVVGAFGVAGLS